MASVTLCYSVDSEDCADIIAYYDKLPRGEKSREFVRVHKMQLENAGVTLADLNRKLDRLLELVAAGVVLGGAQEPGEGDGAEAQADLSALDGLGL